MSILSGFACATCINQEGQDTVIAANGAVFVMLGALALVFFTFLGIMIGFIRRSRRLAQAMGDDLHS